MDVIKALRELYEEKRRLDSAIARLEACLERAPGPHLGRRRGRKSMGEDERREVSKRMQRYWESRKAQALKAQAGGLPTSSGQEQPSS